MMLSVAGIMLCDCM